MNVFSFSVCILLFFGGGIHQTFGDTKYCEDAHECAMDTISSTRTNCYGHYACDSASISSPHVYAYGFDGAHEADISSAIDVAAYGFYAVYGANIMTVNLYAYGYYAAAFSHVEPVLSTSTSTSNSPSPLTLHMHGYRAGYYADVFCRAGDTCSIFCGSAQGCFLLKFYCYTGAECSVECTDDTMFCPTMYSGVDDDISDEEMDALYLSNLEIKNKHVEQKEPQIKAKRNVESADPKKVLGVVQKQQQQQMNPPDIISNNNNNNHHHHTRSYVLLSPLMMISTRELIAALVGFSIALVGLGIKYYYCCLVSNDNKKQEGYRKIVDIYEKA